MSSLGKRKRIPNSPMRFRNSAPSLWDRSESDSSFRDSKFIGRLRFARYLAFDVDRKGSQKLLLIALYIDVPGDERL